MKTTVPNTRNRMEDKKQVNISWNSRLFFQIGIIISCLIVFVLMQTTFQVSAPTVAEKTEFVLEENPMVTYQIDIDKPKPVAPAHKETVKPKVIVKSLKTEILVVKNDSPKEIESEVLATDTPAAVPSDNVESVPEPTTPESVGPSSILNVEFVPVFPGCEGLSSNSETIDCLSSQISAFVSNNFKRDALENLQSNSIQRVSVQFKVDSNGFIKDIRTNSNNEKINKEVKRVIGNLPRMKPGRQGNRTVDVLYTVPITFRIP